MNQISPLLIGIASSLVATFIFLFSRWLLVEILIPWFLDKTYRGIRVDGQWTDREENSDCPVQATLTLKQQSNRITGFYSHIHSEIMDTSITYKVEGEIRDSYVALTCWPIASDHLDASTMLMKVYSHSGLKMKGMDTFISTENGYVKSSEAEYRKVDS